MRAPGVAALAALALLLLAERGCAKRCWFLHGSGCPSEGTYPPMCPSPNHTGSPRGEGPATPTFVEYWGDLHAHTPGCTSWHFNHEDTITQAYDAPRLRERTCQQLCGGPGCVVTDAVIFTHSAGGLYLASALHHGDCHLGASSDWFAVQAPALGSEAASLAQRMCTSHLFHCPLIVPGTCAVARQVLRAMGTCVPSEHNPKQLETTHMTHSCASEYRGLNGTQAPDAMLSVMELHVKGGLCGNHPFGIKCPHGSATNHSSSHSCAVDGLGLWAIGALVHAGPSDGMGARSNHPPLAFYSPRVFADAAALLRAQFLSTAVR